MLATLAFTYCVLLVLLVKLTLNKITQYEMHIRFWLIKNDQGTDICLQRTRKLSWTLEPVHLLEPETNSASSQLDRSSSFSCQCFRWPLDLWVPPNVAHTSTEWAFANKWSTVLCHNTPKPLCSSALFYFSLKDIVLCCTVNDDEYCQSPSKMRGEIKNQTGLISMA